MISRAQLWGRREPRAPATARRSGLARLAAGLHRGLGPYLDTSAPRPEQDLEPTDPADSTLRRRYLMRHLVVVAIVGTLALLGPHGSIPVQPASPDRGPAAPPIYAVDNPAQPGDAFPNGPWSGGTD
jgi:hypothetical protein